MAISRTDIAAALEADIRTGFMRGQESYVSKRAPFTGSTNSDKAFEVYTDFFAPPWPGNKPNGGGGGATGIDGRTGAQRSGSLHEGESIRVYEAGENPLMVYNDDWPLAIGIYHNAINDNQAGDLETWAMGVAARYEQHKDYLAFQALNVGDTDELGLGSDGSPLFSDSHVTPKAKYLTPQDNMFSLALDVTNFNTVVTAGGNFRDEWGQPSGRNHALIVAAHDLKLEAAQVTRIITPTAAEDVNPFAGDVKVIHSPGGYLDNGSWFVVDSSIPQKPIMIQDRQTPQLEIVDDLFNNMGVRYFIWTARYSVFYGDWRLAVKGN